LKVRDDIIRAVEDALRDLGLDAGGVLLERPREAAHGDLSTPVAMSLAKKLRQNPFEIAQKIASSLSVPEEIVSSVEVLKPGFINFRVADPSLRGNLLMVIEQPREHDPAGLRTVLVLTLLVAHRHGDARLFVD